MLRRERLSNNSLQGNNFTNPLLFEVIISVSLIKLSMELSQQKDSDN